MFLEQNKKDFTDFINYFLTQYGRVVILVFSFTKSMKADPEEEKKVRIQAERYLVKNFEDKTEIYDVLYNNMGNCNYFEYATKVKHKKYGTKFLVYFNDETGEMEDTFLSEK
ncbi:MULTISPECIES: hypothetical protein [unclassified Peribacillus]|uniref:hypothetical protein n=1 Tax=unclassified Peribacillus TaxID=2675266 RepID=UPI00366C930D